MSDAAPDALRVIARLAIRNLSEVSEGDREQVLVALVELFPAAEGEIAARMLHGLREQRRLQLELAGILDAKPAQSGNDGGKN